MVPATVVRCFHDLPTALHRVVASYLHAYEALATAATERAMEALYPASITYASIRPRLLSDFGQDKDCGWEAYLDRQGTSLARLLARLPSLKVLTIYLMHCTVFHHAIFFQPCKQLRSIEVVEGNPHGPDVDQYKPSSPHLKAPPSSTWPC